MRNHLRGRHGFTLLELLIVLAILGIIATIVVISIDPARQFAKARNNQRQTNASTILNAIGEVIASNRGSWNCSSGPLPTSTVATMASTGTPPLYDVAPCLVPIYLPNLPFDPSLPGSYFASTTDYNTGYTIIQNPTTTAITITAPGAEIGEEVEVTR